jgi:hypothetical protein
MASDAEILPESNFHVGKDKLLPPNQSQAFFVQPHIPIARLDSF